MPSVILNHQLIAVEKAMVSVQDRGFRFGDGVFETIRVHAGIPYQFDWHAERLRKGLNAVKIACNLHTLHEECRRLLKENAVSDGLLRIQITRGIGSRGYLPALTSDATILIETPPLPVFPDTPVALLVSSYRKISPDMLPVQYKLCQGLSSTLARIEAQEHHCAEALLLNAKQEICETASGNIFWLENGALCTPSLNCGALEGSMRATVLRLSPIPVREVSATLEDLRAADELFITNAVWPLLSVGRLLPDDIFWPRTDYAAQLRALIETDINTYTAEHQSRW